MEIPEVPKPLLEALTQAAAGERCALVGGVVRDLLLHRHHEDPWRGLPDLDVVVEGRAADLVQRLPKALERRFGFSIPLSLQEHGAFGTFEVELELPAEFGGTWLLDVASARQETYPEPGENPTVRPGSLRDDLARRDFAVNAMALELSTGELLDFHHGQSDLSARQLNLLHSSSLRDDPTRWVRGARYAARLGFQFSKATQQQALKTLEQWPWRWRTGDDPAQVPPALGTRLRMELELLFKREPWLNALAELKSVGGLSLLDPEMQRSNRYVRVLKYAQRFQIEMLTALVAGTSQPLMLSTRLQLPQRQHRIIEASLSLSEKILKAQRQFGDLSYMKPSWWTHLLESPGFSFEAVCLTFACQDKPSRPIWQWITKWRFVASPKSAIQIMTDEGIPPGPLLGERLRELRANELDSLSLK